MSAHRLSLVINVSCLVTLALLAGCSNGGGSGHAGATVDFVKPTPSGSFSANKEVPLEQATNADVQLPGAAQNVCGTTETYDSRLRAGDIVVSEQANANTDSASSFNSSEAIQSVDSTHMSAIMTMTNFNVIPTISGLPAQVRMQLDCVAKPSGDGAMIDCKHQFLDGFQAPDMKSAEKWCSVSYQAEAPTTTGTVAIGSYHLQMGQTVTAQRKESTTSGSVVCKNGDQETKMGAGTEYEVTIRTADLLTPVTNNCSLHTTEIYRYRIVKLANGTVLASERNEILAAPQR